MSLSPGGFRRLFSSPRVWLVLILLLAWSLRLYHLDTMSIWWDESLTWDRATNSLPNILAGTIQIQNVATRDLHPPLYFVLLHFATQFAGTTEFGLRILSTLANLLTLALLYPLARIVFGGRSALPGLLAVLFAALSPFYVWYSQEARPYSLVLLWSVLAVYALLRWLRTRPQSGFGLRSRWAFLFVLAIGLTLVTHYLSFVLLPFFAAALLIFDPVIATWRERLRSPLFWLAGGMLVGFCAILVLLPRSSDDLSSWDQAGPRFVPFFIMLRDVWNSFAVGLSANLDRVALLDLFLVALWCLGLFSTLRLRTRRRGGERLKASLALFLFGYLLIPAVAVQLGSFLRPLYLNSRHLITTSPAFYLGLALGVVALARRLSLVLGRFLPGRAASYALPVAHPVLVLVVAAPLLAGVLDSLNNLYFDPAFAKDNHKAWSQFLRERLRPDDYLLLVAPQAEKIVKYYAPPGMQWESLPHLGQTLDEQQYLDRISVLNAYRNHDRVWFLEIHQPVGDPKHAINNLMQRWGEPIDIVYFPGISTQIILQQFVYHSAIQPPEVTIPHPLPTVYDGNLRLLGFDAPAQIQAGGRGSVKLYWRLRQKTPNDLSVSLRVVDAQGKVWGQWDAPPVGNLAPVSQWSAQTIYLDQHDAVVDVGAPPGTYSLQLNVYRAAGHEPLTAKLADGTETDAPVTLAQFQVTRPDPPLDPSQLVMDHHANVPFGNALRFVGYDVEETTASPGGAVPLTLYFQVLGNPGTSITGHVDLSAPWWQVWSPTRTSTPFTLDLAQRRPGDIVTAHVGARVPGDASPGTYSLQFALDALAPQARLWFAGPPDLGAARVEALARSNDLPPILHPQNAQLGDSVEFLGYTLNTLTPLKPGGHVQVTLYWRALKTMDTSYKVFCHLISGESKIFGQRDQEPLNGARPTTSWAPGEVFSDAYEFDIAPDAPPGTYTLEIGMYNPVDFTRLAVSAGGKPVGDHILSEALQVQAP